MPEETVRSVILDVGNVLLDWDPRHLYRKIFLQEDGKPDEERVAWFLENICTQDWNIQQDLGRSIAAARADLIARFPEWKVEIEIYHDRYDEMIPAAIETTVDCMTDLQARGIPVHGLTNFSAEEFARTRQRFDFLNRFDNVIVSGEEGLIKPDPRIFKIAIHRFELVPGSTLFVDDNNHNICAARKIGFHVHHFTTPDGLRSNLEHLGLLA